MSAFEKMIDRAKRNPKKIVLAEGTDSRIQSGAIEAANQGVARCLLLGKAAQILPALTKVTHNRDWISVLDPNQSEAKDRYSAEYYKLRQHKGVTPDDALKAIVDPLTYSSLMVRLGDADGSVAGAVATTSDTVRAALQVIGKHPKGKIVSSFFLMLLEADHHKQHQGAYIFSDCGLVVQPTTDELAEIAIASSSSYENLTGDAPRTAMLSFSTAGSAKHEAVSKVVEAMTLVKQRAPSLKIDGELQFDAAFVPEVASKKAPSSLLQGAANVFIFPNLEAGNIGYKIAQRIGGAEAIGPILQGLAKPANDLSRGCNADDVFKAIVVTVLQAQQSTS